MATLYTTTKKRLCNTCGGYNNATQCAECLWAHSKANLAQRKAKKCKALNDGSVNVGNLRVLWTGVCFYCKEKLIWFDKGTRKKKGKSTIDHKVSFVKGGKNTIDNVVWCCYDCNRWKQDESVETFLEIRRQWEEGYRRCCDCLEFKLFSEFHKDKRARGGIRRICKTCHNEWSRKGYRRGCGTMGI